MLADLLAGLFSHLSRDTPVHLEVWTILTKTDVSESLFNIFDTTYDDDQKRSHTDYIELSMQSPFNKRAL
jgi:hypothetical protein